MNFWRAILASILSLLCTLSVSAFVTLQTLNNTVMDKTQVKSWLAESGVYDNLLNSFIASDQTAQQQTTINSSAVSSDTAQKALNQTFTPAYIKQASEQVIDGTYDWLDGRTSTPTYSINTTTQKDSFTTKLSALLEPQLASLPRCTSANQFNASSPNCLPAGTSAKQAADSLATDAANSASIFAQPISNDSVAKASKDSNQTASPLTTGQSNQLPQIVQTTRLWLIWLPIIAVLSGVLMVALSQHKIKAGRHLAGKLTIGLLITFGIGLLVANIGRSIRLSDFISGTNAFMTGVIEPVIHQAAPAIGGQLAIISGICTAVTFVTWLTLYILFKRRQKAELLKPDEASASRPASQPPAAKADSPNAPAESNNKS